MPGLGTLLAILLTRELAAGDPIAPAFAPPACILAAAAAADTPPRGEPDSSADSSLAATSAPPWNPPHVIARRRLWEQAVLLPGRIVTLPLSGLDDVSNRMLLMAEKRAL